MATQLDCEHNVFSFSRIMPNFFHALSLIVETLRISRNYVLQLVVQRRVAYPENGHSCTLSFI